MLTRAADPAPAQLTSVTVAYLPRNSRPSVTSITVYPPGVVFQRPFSSDDGAIAGLDDATALARRPPGDPDQPLSVAGQADVPEGPANARVESRGRRWRSVDLRAAVPARGRNGVARSAKRPHGPAVRVGHDVGARRPLSGARAGLRRIHQRRRAGARRRPRERPRRDRQHAAANHRVGDEPRHPDAPDGPRPRRAESDPEGRVLRLPAAPGSRWLPVDGLADSPDERYEIALPAGTDVARVVVRATDQLQNVSSAAAGGR